MSEFKLIKARQCPGNANFFLCRRNDDGSWSCLAETSKSSIEILEALQEPCQVNEYRKFKSDQETIEGRPSHTGYDDGMIYRELEYGSSEDYMGWGGRVEVWAEGDSLDDIEEAFYRFKETMRISMSRSNRCPKQRTERVQKDIQFCIDNFEILGNVLREKGIV